MFEHVLLEPEQEQLLSMLVEAAQSIPRDERRKFVFRDAFGGGRLYHPGLPETQLKAYKGDIETLAGSGLLSLSYGQGGALHFDVAPLGLRYYEEMQRQAGEPIQRAQTRVMQYLDADPFRRKYPAAYQKWQEAETLLWSSDLQSQLTTIGHLCREALQEFATVLVEQYQPPEVDTDKAHTVNRIRAVLDLKRDQLGTTEAPFLDTLLSYWGTVSDLIQRQEHGGQKEGEPLVWADGRRVVFQTMLLMYEIDSSLSRPR